MRRSPRIGLFDGHREAFGTEVIGRCGAQAIDDAELDVELRTVRDKRQFDREMCRTGAGSVRRDGRKVPGQRPRQGHEPRRTQGRPLTNAVYGVWRVEFGSPLHVEGCVGRCSMDVDVDLCGEPDSSSRQREVHDPGARASPIEHGELLAVSTVGLDGRCCEHSEGQQACPEERHGPRAAAGTVRPAPRNRWCHRATPSRAQWRPCGGVGLAIGTARRMATATGRRAAESPGPSLPPCRSAEYGGVEAESRGLSTGLWCTATTAPVGPSRLDASAHV